MQVYGHNMTKVPEGWDIDITYRPTPRSDKAVARILVTEGESERTYTVLDMGRKVRATKAEQERVYELIRVARRWFQKEAL